MIIKNVYYYRCLHRVCTAKLKSAHNVNKLVLTFNNKRVSGLSYFKYFFRSRTEYWSIFLSSMLWPIPRKFIITNSMFVGKLDFPFRFVNKIFFSSLSNILCVLYFKFHSHRYISCVIIMIWCPKFVLNTWPNKIDLQQFIKKWTFLLHF